MPVQSKLVTLGSLAPEFKLSAASGTEVSLSEHRGKRCVVVVFLRGFR